MGRRGRAALVVAAGLAAVAAVWLAADRRHPQGTPLPLDRFAFTPRVARFDLRADHRERGLSSFVPFRPLVLAEGWAGPEDWGVWGLGAGSRLELAAPSGEEEQLYLECLAHPDRIRRRRQTLTVRLDGRDLGTFPVTETISPLWVDLPARASHAGRRHLELAYGYGTSPIEQGAGPDRRPLAVGFRRLALLPGRERLPQPEEWPPGAVFRRDSGVLEVREAGRLLLPVRSTGGARAVTFRAGGGRFRVEAGLVEGDAVSRPAGLAARLGRGRRVELPRGAGDAWVAWDVEPGGSGFSLSDVRLITEGQPAPAVAAARPAARPDVVVILLDAARADHFGCYGYPRDTTPVIDRVAREGLVFTRAFSATPYTLAAVPSLLTGLSFPRHGVVTSRRRLAASAVTLAERLQGAGYRTLAFSANPHDSPAQGLDRGYDEFHEVWRGVDEATALDPFSLVRQVEERLAAGLDERPLHLLVHLVPPHAPYTPRTQFDLFGDPAYAGPVDGSQANVTALYEAGRVPPAPDLAELVALYDGNLRAADAAVGALIAALQRCGRWDGTVVAITADHGEAFFEHGWLGHNTTLHAEMLHVPLVLRLPPDLRSAAVDRARLASLADLTPTLLGLLGLDPDPAAAGVDLLRPLGEPSPSLERFVMRTATDPIVFGLRTGRWQAMFSADGLTQELYDLERDPAETVNLALDHPEVMSTLDLLLADALATATPAAGGPAPPFTRDERGMLKALGYVE